MAVLKRIPPHMAYNVTTVDRRGNFKTGYLSPDRRPVVRQFPVATNHQGRIEWMEHAHATATLEREQFLFSRIADSEETAEGLVDSFLRPPLFSRAYRKGYGTLYTAVYRPRKGMLELRWPNGKWVHTFDEFRQGRWTVQYVDDDRLAAGNG